jgi:HSP20 family protein
MTTHQRTTEQQARGGAGSETSARDSEGARAESERPVPTTGEGARQGQTAQKAPARRGERRPTRTAWPGFFPRTGGIPVTPWELMRRMSDEMTQILDFLSRGQPATSVAQRGSGTTTTPRAGTSGAGETGLIAFTPQIEVIERPDALVVRADLPGVNANDVSVSIDDGVLTIQGEREQEQREERDGVVRSERVYGTFFRAIPLPDGAEEERIDATFRNGVLEIAVPVSRRQSGRRIDVRSQS